MNDPVSPQCHDPIILQVRSHSYLSSSETRRDEEGVVGGRGEPLLHVQVRVLDHALHLLPQLSAFLLPSEWVYYSKELTLGRDLIEQLISPADSARRPISAVYFGVRVYILERARLPSKGQV